jgi:hypothetical protein
MTTAAIQKKIYEAIKGIDDMDFLTNIQQLVYDKAGRGTISISDEEWDEITHRSQKAKKNLKNLKSWKTIKKNLTSSK